MIRPEGDTRARAAQYAARQRLIDWQGHTEARRALRKELKKALQKPTVAVDQARESMLAHPLDLIMYPTLHAAEAKQVAVAHAAAISARFAPPLAFGRRKLERGQSLRVGYMSSDLGAHVVGRLMEATFRHHKAILPTCVSIAPNNAVLLPGISSSCRIVKVGELGDGAFVTRLRQEKFHVIVDLNGHSGAHRLAALSQGLAPVQAFHLGTPLTTGSPSIAYFIGDSLASPPPTSSYFSEKMVYLPYTYHVNSHREAPPLVATKPLPMMLRLANLDRKVDPDTFSAWVNALLRVATRENRALLWMLESDHRAKSLLVAEAAARGASAERISVVERAPHIEHISRVVSADLYLDTPRCNSVATLADVIWAGVPFVASPLDALPSRGSSSLLRATRVGHSPERIGRHSASSLKAYEDLVVAMSV